MDSLLLDVHGVDAGVQFLVAELEEAIEGDPQVGRLEQVLHLLAVRVDPGRVDVDVRRQHAVDHLKIAEFKIWREIAQTKPASCHPPRGQKH